MTMDNSMRLLAIVLLTGVAGCGPDLPPADPAAAQPRVDTTAVTIGAVQYTVKLDGTLYFPRTPINLTMSATPASPDPPSVTRLEVAVTPEGAADPSAQTTFPLRWVANGGRWRADIRNTFPDPDPAYGDRLGRLFPAGSYHLTVGLYEGDRLAGQAGPLEVYLGFIRTGD